MTPKGPYPHPDSPDNVPARRNAKKNTAKEEKQVKDEKEEG